MKEFEFAIPTFSLDAKSIEGRQVRKVIRVCSSQVGRARVRPGSLVFEVENAFHARASATANARVLEALMVCLTDLDTVYRCNRPLTPLLYTSGVVYKRTEVWDATPMLYAKQFGDCKSLAASRVAELRCNGIWARVVFRFLPGTRMTMYHILVLRGMVPGLNAPAMWEDPSKALGMQVPQEFSGESMPTPIENRFGRMRARLGEYS